MAFIKTNDVPCKDSTVVASVDLSNASPTTRRKFKTRGLDGSEYFTSLEIVKKSKSQMTVVIAIPGGNIATMLFDKFCQTGCNFGESENSTDSPISMKVNALIADATDMTKKFTMMEQTIEALKKSLDYKNLQIAQLMNRLETFAPIESSHIPLVPYGFPPQNKEVKESLAKSNLVAALSVQHVMTQIGGP
ncbi:hypothetical protein K7X08_000774 [Anisodus acutangulus]|uniref:Uncharacterized protein n=1 Tax=Anisodus acutangulus TaxID=402998 RepID=A0A9Q1M7Z2_9SOLA|nr:hypothetical protein K7X08_000774 [Anisodus acutangulus]